MPSSSDPCSDWRHISDKIITRLVNTDGFQHKLGATRGGQRPQRLSNEARPVPLERQYSITAPGMTVDQSINRFTFLGASPSPHELGKLERDFFEISHLVKAIMNETGTVALEWWRGACEYFEEVSDFHSLSAFFHGFRTNKARPWSNWQQGPCLPPIVSHSDDATCAWTPTMSKMLDLYLRTRAVQFRTQSQDLQRQRLWTTEELESESSSERAADAGQAADVVASSRDGHCIPWRVALKKLFKVRLAKLRGCTRKR